VDDPVLVGVAVHVGARPGAELPGARGAKDIGGV
jgi:hypothetical protein